MRCSALPTLLLLSGCCKWQDPPVWTAPASVEVDGGDAEYDLYQWVDTGGDLEFTVSSSDPGLIAWVSGATLLLQAQVDWQGTSDLTLTVTDDCGGTASTTVSASLGDGTDTGEEDTGGTEIPDYRVDPCAITFSYKNADADAVFVAGTFNEWSASKHPMALEGGTWTVSIPKEDIPPGNHTYKFVVQQGSTQAWTCDPEGGLIQCDEGYKQPSDYDWSQECTLNGTGCNSMVVVDDFDLPVVKVEKLSIDRAGNGVDVEVSFSPGCSGGEASSWSATLDGGDLPADTWTGEGFSYSTTGLSEGRHTLRFNVTDADGNVAPEVYVPFWTDEQGWDKGLMYYAFLDRVVDGDTGLNHSEGATWANADYLGGDFQGLIDLVPYLSDIGVTVLWISNPVDNAEGAWSGDCGSYAGYHAYWPSDPFGVEEHYGDEEDLKRLVDTAHANGMRVLMDWVCNHVHQDHPYYTSHPYNASAGEDNWFTEPIMCKVGDDYSNFDLIPEVCWFAEYLPDIRFYNKDPLAQVVDDAIWWIKEYEFDGFRVDGAKHVPHSVMWNLSQRLNEQVEYRYAGGDEDFYTVGETFTTSYDLIKDYVNDRELDAQFDFPLYFTLRSTFIDGTASFYDLQGSMEASRSAYGDALMGTFLGNHDVSRFLSYATAGGWADSSESACMVADVPTDPWWYGRLSLAWTWLLTNPGLPMIYYGDELGIPGYKDPDNRHPFWWYSSGLSSGSSIDLDAVMGGLYHSEHQTVLDHVAALGTARQEHPAFWSGTETEWWIENDVYAYARVSGSDEILVVLNRSSSDRSLSNAMDFAGLTGASYTDIFTGEALYPSSSSLSFTVQANSARVYVKD